MKRASVMCICVLQLWQSSCTPQETAARQSAVTVRDSVGIQIVENAAFADTAVRWSIDSTSTVSIGGQNSAHDGSEYQFHRLQGAALMPSREIVVADWGSTTVRVFDSTGLFVRNLVRKGEGPGELSSVSALFHTRGDSLVAYNGESGKLIVFGPDLKLARTVARLEFRPDSTRQEHSSPGIYGIFDDGTVLASGKSAHGFDWRTDVPGQPWKQFTDSTNWIRGRTGDVQMAAYGWLHGKRGMYGVVKRSSYAVRINDLPQGMIAVRGTDLYYVDGAKYEARIYGNDGKARRLIRMSATPVAITDDNREKWPDSLVRPPTPLTFPMIDALVVDFSGSIWLGSRHPTEKRPARVWHVFDSTGALQQRVVDRSGMTVYEVGPDYLLGVVRDADGVESVVKHALRKP